MFTASVTTTNDNKKDYCWLIKVDSAYMSLTIEDNYGKQNIANCSKGRGEIYGYFNKTTYKKFENWCIHNKSFYNTIFYKKVIIYLKLENTQDSSKGFNVTYSDGSPQDDTGLKGLVFAMIILGSCIGALILFCIIGCIISVFICTKINSRKQINQVTYVTNHTVTTEINMDNEFNQNLPAKQIPQDSTEIEVYEK